MGYRLIGDGEETMEIGTWKLVWGGDLDLKPDYFINETPLEDKLRKKITIIITKLPGYTVSVYYHQGILYFVVFPMDFPGLNVTANYGNDELIYKWLEQELKEREITVPKP